MAYAKDQAPLSAEALQETIRQKRHFDAVPIVDFGGMLSDSPPAKQKVASDLRDACTRVGFFYLTNHNVPESLVERAFHAARQFFAEPENVKMRCNIAQSGQACGYVALMAEDGDLHEAFDFTMEDRVIDGQLWHADFRHVGNQWPEGLEEFRSALTEYSDAMRRLARQIFAALALALELPEDFFAADTDHPLSLLRILHYPSQGGELPDGKVGAGAHTDHECFTILRPDDVQALQVRNGNGEWLFVTPIPGTFVINVGDLLSRWSNDRFVSTMHRVVNLTGLERYSIPFFVGPNHDATVEVLPSCVDGDNPPRYEPIIAGEYVMSNILSSLNAPPSD